MLIPHWLVFLAVLAAPGHDSQPIDVRMSYGPSREIDIGELVVRLAKATDVDVARPKGRLSLPVAGLGGSLSRRTLTDILGSDAALELRDGALLVSVRSRVREPGARPEWKGRLLRLSELVERETERRMQYGMHALKSYRPNDPGRPTVCLVHGVNSNSGGFVHMIAPLEEAGYGVVVYDYPYNRRLEESCEDFRADWAAFRKKNHETQPWAILAHSMGALVARSYVEAPRNDARDVKSVILVGPVSQGSSLAKAQTLLQLINGLKAVQAQKTSQALARLADGLGEAAEDMTPGSAFLRQLNRRPRRAGVPYHILAGDAGFLSRTARQQIETQLAVVRRQKGLLGNVARLATVDLAARLDEFTEGAGDGCISVERSRLDGVSDHVVIHANHAELIRAPLLFPDPGPVACMPYVLRWLKQDFGADVTTAGGSR